MTETVGVGTRNDMPVSLPFTSGQMSPTAFAAGRARDDVDCRAPTFQSFLLGPSTVF